MNQADAKIISAVRTIESMPEAAEFWSGGDASDATRLANEEVGEDAGLERFLEVRARIAWQKIAAHRPDLLRLLDKRFPGNWLGFAIVAAALIGGILADQIGDSKQINLLAPPFVAIIVWNVAMYFWLMFRWVVSGWLGFEGSARRRLATMLSGSVGAIPDGRRGSKAGLRAHVLAQWAKLYLPVALERAALVWHLAAASLAMGLIAGMYVRAFYTEYRVGWESTLLDPQDISAGLALILEWVPATFGLVAPDSSVVEAMRFSARGGLAGARPWLHLMASLAVMLVVLPRIALALIARCRARRLERQFPMDLSDGYFKALAVRHGRRVAEVIAVPYAKMLSPSAAIALGQVVREAFGSRSKLKVLDPVPFGSEDNALPALPGNPESIALILFDLASTPENENHGAFMKKLKVQGSSGCRVIALVDSCGFRARFGDAGARLDQRTGLWMRFLGDLRVPCVIADLAEDAVAGLAADLESALAHAGGEHHG